MKFLFLLLSSISLVAMEQDIHKEIFAVQGRELTVYTNQPLNERDTNIDRIIVAIQGNKREAKGRVRTAQHAAASVDYLERTLIISPHFKAEKDVLAGQEFFWSNAGWKQGDKSRDAGRQSSFALLDTILTTVLKSKNFPSVKKVFVTGHSAGGQFAQRYALTTPITHNFQRIKFNFLVLNPSSYTYLNNLRVDQTSPGNFTATVSVKDYDNFKYGLVKRNAYAAASDDVLIKQYLKRNVFYVLGTLDNDPQHDELDRSDAAMLQGNDRLSRGRIYQQHLSTYFPRHRHRSIEVDGVGHDAEKIYDAVDVKAILFSP